MYYYCSVYVCFIGFAGLYLPDYIWITLCFHIFSAVSEFILKVRRFDDPRKMILLRMNEPSETIVTFWKSTASTRQLHQLYSQEVPDLYEELGRKSKLFVKLGGSDTNLRLPGREVRFLIYFCMNQQLFWFESLNITREFWINLPQYCMHSDIFCMWKLSNHTYCITRHKKDLW